jgi:hypothetical protein
MPEDAAATWCVATKDHHLFLSATSATSSNSADTGDIADDGPVFRSFGNAVRFRTEGDARRRCDWAQEQFDVPSTYPLTVVAVAEIEQELADREALLEVNGTTLVHGSLRSRNPYITEMAQLMVMAEDVREIRVRICDPETGLNPRYMALSNVIAYLNEVVDDLHAEG